MEMKKKLIFFFNSLYFEFEEAICKIQVQGEGDPGSGKNILYLSTNLYIMHRIIYRRKPVRFFMPTKNFFKTYFLQLFYNIKIKYILLNMYISHQGGRKKNHSQGTRPLKRVRGRPPRFNFFFHKKYAQNVLKRKNTQGYPLKTFFFKNIYLYM